jgi:hypothetical protein
MSDYYGEGYEADPDEAARNAAWEAEQRYLQAEQWRAAQLQAAAAQNTLERQALEAEKANTEFAASVDRRLAEKHGAAWEGGGRELVGAYIVDNPEALPPSVLADEEKLVATIDRAYETARRESDAERTRARQVDDDAHFERMKAQHSKTYSSFMETQEGQDFLRGKR